MQLEWEMHGRCWDDKKIQADWNTWAFIPTTTLQEAVFLSLDLEPAPQGFNHALVKACAQIDKSDPIAVLRELNRRMTIASANVEELAGPSMAYFRDIHIRNAKVLLTKFGAWADNIGWSLPDKFPRQTAPAQNTATPVPVVTESEPMMPAPDTQAGQVAPAVVLSNGDGSASIFREMADLTASELTLAFVGEKPESGLGANNMLEVTARGQKRRIALASLELVDKRKGTPNGECGVLLGLAQGIRPKKSSPNTQKMKRLRTVFLHHFGMVKDPFEPYMAATGWVPLFEIVDRRGAADERAKKEAEERMVSLQQLEEQGVQTRDYSNNDADSWMKKNGYSY